MSSITFYVYVLARPNGKPFYVGKGHGHRIYDHDTEARSGHRCKKCHTIRKIWRQGGVVQRYIVFTTESEQEAFAYEADLIALYGRSTLANRNDGAGGGSWTEEQRLAKSRAYSTPEARERLRAEAKAQWSDPDIRARMLASNRTPEARAKHSALFKAMWADRKAKSLPRTHCRNGHELTEENVVFVSGQRLCRTCRRANRHRQDERRKQLRIEASGRRSIREA